MAEMNDKAREKLFHGNKQTWGSYALYYLRLSFFLCWNDHLKHVMQNMHV